MRMNNLKEAINIVEKKNLYRLQSDDNEIIKFKPWLGDLFSCFYDRIMEKSIFPKKFKANIQSHFKILKNEFNDTHNKDILEIATGSGNSAYFLSNDINYYGIDISTGLFQEAFKKFINLEFKNVKLFVANVDSLPFNDNSFDICICNLSLFFLKNTEIVISEIKRILKTDGVFVSSVPVPERNKHNTKIRGVLHTEDELKMFFQKYNFQFERIPYVNGALLYFKSKLLK